MWSQFEKPVTHEAAPPLTHIISISIRMKTSAPPVRPLCAIALLMAFSFTACTRDQAGSGTAGAPRRIPLAPVGVSSPGIGAPGAGSMDTRATGTIATGQGDSPVADPVPGSVPVSAAGNTPGTRASGLGQRY